MITPLFAAVIAASVSASPIHKAGFEVRGVHAPVFEIGRIAPIAPLRLDPPLIHVPPPPPPALVAPRLTIPPVCLDRRDRGSAGCN